MTVQWPARFERDKMRQCLISQRARRPVPPDPLSLLVPPQRLLLIPAAAHAQGAPAATAESQAKNSDWLYAGSDIPRDTAWQFGVLPNGVRYAVRNNGVPPGRSVDPGADGRRFDVRNQ